MKLLINCISLMLGYTFNIIGLVFLPRPVYISSLIQLEQVYYIQKSIAKIGLTQTYDKTENRIIRIQYDNTIIGNTAMTSNLYSTGNFVVEKTTISVNPNLYDEILGCVILHELGHSVGLFHSNESGSIMNFTLFVNKDGIILNDNTECYLSDDDLLALEYMRQKK